MAKDNRIYHVRSPWKTAITVLSIIIIVAVILAMVIFVSFRKYIVYTDNGVRLEVPWLMEAEEEQKSAEPEGETP